MKSNIKLSEICGENLYTRDDGNILFKKIQDLLLENDSVIVDFENKEISSESFMDEAIVEFYMNSTIVDPQKKIILKNVVETDQMLLRRIYFYRKQLQEKGNKRKKK